MYGTLHCQRIDIAINHFSNIKNINKERGNTFRQFMCHGLMIHLLHSEKPELLEKEKNLL